MFLNRQLGSELVKNRIGKGRLWLGMVGLGLGRIGVTNADSYLSFLMNFFESATDSDFCF